MFSRVIFNYFKLHRGVLTLEEAGAMGTISVGVGRRRSLVVEDGFRAFHRAKMSPQDTQLNISCIVSSN